MPETVFGRKLAELRKAKGLTQAALADKSGLSVPGIRGMEQGYRQPTWESVQLLVAALGVDYAELETQKPKRGKR